MANLLKLGKYSSWTVERSIPCGIVCGAGAGTLLEKAVSLCAFLDTKFYKIICGQLSKLIIVTGSGKIQHFCIFHQN